MDADGRVDPFDRCDESCPFFRFQQVGLVDTDEGLHAAVLGDQEKAVDETEVQTRTLRGSDDDDLIAVRDDDVFNVGSGPMGFRVYSRQACRSR